MCRPRTELGRRLMNSADAGGSCPNEALWRLVGSLCDGTLTEADRDGLESLLRDDHEAKQFVAAYLDLHAQILWRHREAVASEEVAGIGRPAEDSIQKSEVSASP